MRKIVSIFGIIAFLCTQWEKACAMEECSSYTIISEPNVCGSFYGDFTWVHLHSCPTDGDLQTGTFLNLTIVPANLTARVQQQDPSPFPAFRASLGYMHPCNNSDFNLNFFYFSPHDSSAKAAVFDPPNKEQFFQNFLGKSWVTFQGSADQRIYQINATTGRRFIIDRCLHLHPYVGIAYADISRTVVVNYETQVPDLAQLRLIGTEQSDFCSTGPIVGMDFSYPLCNGFFIDGGCESGLLYGKIRANVDSTQFDENGVPNDSYLVCTDYWRAAPFLKSHLSLAYRPCFKIGCFALELKGGYETDYYFKVVDRINPLDGYLLNSQPVAIKTSSNWGMGGPFIKVSLLAIESDEQEECVVPYRGDHFDGFYAKATASWLKADSTNDDLVYAILNKNDTSMQDLEAGFNYTYAGNYEVGYAFCQNARIFATYFHFDDSSKTETTASSGEFISSVNSSGDIFVEYASSSSKASYDLDQIEVKIGKGFAPFCQTELLLDFGIRYAQLERTMHNHYDGGVPAAEFETKNGILKSKFCGTGPVFSVSPIFNICDNLDFQGTFSTALLVGDIKSTLDQVNNGVGVETSNTLSTPTSRCVVPVLDLLAAIHYSTCFSRGMTVEFSLGYQFSDYYRAINLVYPNFRTGLQQINSDLKLNGPFISLKLANF